MSRPSLIRTAAWAAVINLYPCRSFLPRTQQPQQALMLWPCPAEAAFRGDPKLRTASSIRYTAGHDRIPFPRISSQDALSRTSFFRPRTCKPSRNLCKRKWPSKGTWDDLLASQLLLVEPWIQLSARELGGCRVV